MYELVPKELAATVPPLYATEDEAEPIVRVKLFSCFNGWTWLVTEYDPESGEAVSYTHLTLPTTSRV